MKLSGMCEREKGHCLACLPWSDKKATTALQRLQRPEAVRKMFIIVAEAVWFSLDFPPAPPIHVWKIRKE